MEQVKEIKKVIKKLEEKQGEDYKNFIIGLLCIEFNIEPNEQNLEVLNNIYYKYMKSDYTLLHDMFYDEKERELLGL